MSVFLTGDTHGDFDRVEAFVKRHGLTSEDVVIILGDAGLNYHGGVVDKFRKEQLAVLAPTFFCVHGNHEKRPQHISTYHEMTWHGGTVLVEDAYPNILFPIDGEVFDFNGESAVVIGGAYSVDKDFRLRNGWKWFADEQPSDVIKAKVESALAKHAWKIDYVLTHTCPLRYEPIEVFISGIDQSKVDQSTEEWLETIEEKLDYKRWYCGHFHTCKSIDRIRFMFEDWILLE